MTNLLTTDDVAEILGVSAARVRQLINEGRIKSEKVGRDHVIKRSDLNEFLKLGKKKRGRPKNSLC